MTKKEEIIDFASTVLEDEKNILQLSTELVEVDPNSGLTAGESCVIEMHARKQRVLAILSDNFNDELIGTLPHGVKIHQIISWTVLPKEAR
jgi:hypothetical protein